MVARVLAITLIAVAALALPRPCAACSCAAREPEEMFADAPYVFHGQVTHVSDVDDGKMHATLLIDTVWKGPVVSEAVLLGGSEASCYVSFAEGQDYLVFARDGADDVLATDICSGTNYVRKVHIAAFAGPGEPVPIDAPTRMPSNVVSTEDDGWGTLQFATVLTLVGTIAVACVYVVRRWYTAI